MNKAPMNKIAVFGAKGNMGRRQCLILKRFTHVEAIEFDMNSGDESKLKSCDGFIIATPTETHYALINQIAKYRKPILCETPVVKNREKLNSLLSIDGIDLSMVNQYAFIQSRKLSFNDDKHTYFNYYNTGNDGLLWDCINIIGLAETSYDVKNDSPIWGCNINGYKLSLDYMDDAFVNNVVSWIRGWRNSDYIVKAHDKIWKEIYD